MTRQRRATYEAEVLTRELRGARRSVVQGVITSSLFGAVSDAGEDDQLALDLAEIFAWDVDFNTELQKGDSFRVAVEKLYLDGRFVPLRAHPLRRARARRRACCRAVRFDGENGPGYYTPDGHAAAQGVPALAR